MIGTGFSPSLPQIGGCHPCLAGTYAATGLEGSCQACPQGNSNVNANSCSPTTGQPSSCNAGYGFTAATGTGVIATGGTVASCSQAQCSASSYSDGTTPCQLCQRSVPLGVDCNPQTGLIKTW